MTVILYLPQRVRISRFDCSQTGFGKQLAFVFHKTHPHIFTYFAFAHAWSFAQIGSVRARTPHPPPPKSLHTKHATNLTNLRYDDSDDSMKMQTCQLVTASPWRGCGSSLLILESCEEAGECWSCWVWLNLAKLGKRGQGFNPSPIPWSCVHTFQESVCGVGMDGKGQNVGDRWKEKDPEWKRRKKKTSKHAVVRPLASVLLPRDGECACECVLVWIVRLGWLFVASICQDYCSPIDVPVCVSVHILYLCACILRHILYRYPLWSHCLVYLHV